MNKRQATELAFAIVLVMVNPLFLIISIPLTGVFLIDCLICKKKIPKKQNENEIPIEEENNVEQIRATVEEIEEKNNNDLEYRKKVDTRQFKGRDNVTKEEVAKYLWCHYIWEGFHEKIIICEEISKVSNITKNDIDWIIKDHYNHEWKKGKYGAGCWIRNEEVKREHEYNKKKAIEFDNEMEKFKKQVGNWKQSNNIDENYKYKFYYEDWLKEKGYI